MADMDTPQSLGTAGDIPPERSEDERRTSRAGMGAASTRGRKSTGAADATASAGSPLVETEAPARARRGPRVSRPRTSHTAPELAQTQPTLPPETASSQVEPSARNRDGIKAAPSTRSSRGSRTTPRTGGAAGRRQVRAGTPTNSATQGDAPEVAVSQINEAGNRATLERVESSPDTSAPGAAASSSFAAEPYRPAARSPYRFGRSRQEVAALDTAGETDVSSSRPIEATDSRQQPPSPAVAEHGHRPLRRPGWSAQNGQDSEIPGRETRTSRERVQPHVPGGTDSYRDRDRDRGRQPSQRSGGANPSRISGGHPGQRGQFSNPPAGRGSAPYSPGGRAGHASSPSQPPISGQDMPYAPAGGQNNNNAPIPGGPYAGYDPYDPYAFDPRDSRASHDRTGQSGRPVRGRGYANQSGGYDQRDSSRSRQSSSRPPSPADYYRREQGLTGQRDVRGLPPGRGGLGSHGPHDRRGGGGSRGP
ncbi:MAG: hypothetical protein C5B60_06075, partial [Chloroflexi bacterium]